MKYYIFSVIFELIPQLNEDKPQRKFKNSKVAPLIIRINNERKLTLGNIPYSKIPSFNKNILTNLTIESSLNVFLLYNIIQYIPKLKNLRELTISSFCFKYYNNTNYSTYYDNAIQTFLKNAITLPYLSKLYIYKSDLDTIGILFNQIHPITDIKICCEIYKPLNLNEMLNPQFINNITKLDLSYTPIICEGIKYLSKKHFSQLTDLNLSHQTSQSICKAFSSKLNFDQIKTLKLDWFYTSINLIKDNSFRGVTYLSMNCSDITDENIGWLFSGNLTIENLTYLDLSSNFLDIKGVKCLQQGYYKELLYLGLSHSILSDNGLKYISEIKFYKLKDLAVQGNKITDVGAKYLTNSNLSTRESLY